MSRPNLWRLCTSLALSFVLVQSTLAAPPQQSQVSSSQAATLLQKSLAALVGNASISDITLTGTVRRIAGSDDQTGSASLKALLSGSVRSDLSFTSGTRTEIYIPSNSGLAGAWFGPDRKSHAVALHNLPPEPAWFFPTFALSRRLSVGYIVTDIGPETRDGRQVEHISVSQNPPSQLSADSQLFQHLTQLDIYLDSETLLPSTITCNTHPDDNALLDIPVEIDFSDYRSVSGTQIPFHIQKFLNNSLLLDFQAQNAVINSGLSASEFTLQ